MGRGCPSAKRFFRLGCVVFLTVLCALWEPRSVVADGNGPPVLSASSHLAPLGDIRCGIFTNAPLPTGASAFSNGVSCLPPSGDLPMGIYTNVYPFDVPSYLLSEGWDRSCDWWYYLGVATEGDIDQNDFAAATRGQAKWFAHQAALASSLAYPDGSCYADLISALAAPLTPSNDLAPVTVGEIKNLSLLFWLQEHEQLELGNLMYGRGAPPWTGTNQNDSAFANVGQLKNAFSVSIEYYFEDYVDSDQDGFPDGLELDVGMDPYAWDPFDPDGDGIGTAYELMEGTDPLDPDTDGDGLPDGWEIRHGTTPLVQDQWDDPDEDGIANLWEYIHGLDPNSYDDYMGGDPDNDGLYFEDELQLCTDPLNPDMDGDGLPDGWEFWHGLDPLSTVGDDGAYGDPDEDCVANIWEYLHGYSPDLYDCHPWDDPDGDGLDTEEEFYLGTDPFNLDTDGDGLPDGWEYQYGLDPCSGIGDDGPDGDPDWDGWTNLEEYRYGMDPTTVDTDSDNDGVPDALELHLFGELSGMNSLNAVDPNGISLLFVLWNGLDFGMSVMPFAQHPYDYIVSQLLPELPSGTPRMHGATTICERTVTVDTLNGWRQFFISDADYDIYPYLQGMNGVVIEWSDSNGTNGVLSAAELAGGSAPRIPLIPSATPTRLTIRIRTTGSTLDISGSPCLVQCTAQFSYSVTGGYESMSYGMGGEQIVLINCADSEDDYYVTATPGWGSPASDLDLSDIPVAGPPPTLGTMLGYDDAVNGTAAQGVSFVPSPGIYHLPETADPYEADEYPDTTLVAIAPGFRGGNGMYDVPVSYDEDLEDYPDGDGYPLDTPCLRKAVNSVHSYTNSVTYRHFEFSLSYFDLGCPGADAYVTVEEQQDGLVIVYFEGEEIWRGYPDINLFDYTEFTETTEYRIGSDGECCADGCGGGDCDALDGPNLGSVRFRLSLGRPDANTLAGFLWFDSRNGLAVTPSCLSLLKNEDSEIDDVTSGGTRHVTCRDDHGRDIFISTVVNGIEISVFLEDSSLDCVWRITNVNGSETELNFQKISRLGNIMRDETFTRVVSGSRFSEWVRADNISGLTERLHRTDTLSVNNSRVLARETRDASGDLLSCVTNRYEVFKGKTHSVIRETGRSERNCFGGTDTSSVSYWADFTNPKRNGKPRLSMVTGEPWSYRAYDDSGRETFRLEQWGNFGVPHLLQNGGDCDRFSLPEDATCTMTVSEYLPHSGDSFDEGNIEKPRTESVYLVRDGAATLTGRTWYIHAQSETNGATVTTVRTIRAASQSAEIGDPGNAVSVRTAYEDYGGIPSILRGKTLHEKDEDGLERFYGLDAGTFDPATRTFTPGIGGTALRTVTRTFRDGLEADTREVEIQDFDSGNTLYEATELTADGTAVSWTVRAYDIKGRLRSSLHPDGSSETNAWSCCRLLWSRSRDNAVTLRSAQTGRDRLYHAFENVSATNLPGLPGRAGHPVTMHFFDALGRETNVTETAALVPGSAATPDFQKAGGSAATVTEYPRGTSDFRITTDPRGLRTLTRTSRWCGSETEETVTFPPEGEGGPDISLIRSGDWILTPARYFESVTRSSRPGGWETENGLLYTERFPDYSPDGCRADYEVAWETVQYVTNRVTRYDFLGRAVSVTTPSGTSSNIYDGASSRILRSVAPDGAVTEYGYDTEGNRVATRPLASGIAESDTNRYETADGSLWRVEEKTLTASNGVTRSGGVTRTRLTGLSDALRAETRVLDADGVETVSVQSFDGTTGILRSSVSNSLCATPGVTLSVAGNAVASSSASGRTEYLYDSRGRRCGELRLSPSGVTNIWRSLALSDAGDVTNRVTVWADGLAATNDIVSDCRGNVAEERDAEGGVAEREYDGWNRPALTGGNAAYPVRYGYDARGNRSVLATTHDGITWDTNRWSFDFEGRATNRVFADGATVSWGYDAAGRLASKRNARGLHTTYVRDAAGRPVSRLVASAWYERNLRSYDEWGDLAGEIVDEDAGWTQLNTSYARDERGNATNETVEIYGAEYRLARTFDGHSRLASLAVEGETSFYAYDAENRLASVSNAAFTVTYAFTPDGLDAGYTVAFTNGTVVTRAVSRHPYRRELVTGVTNTVNNATVSTYAYAHDRLGRVVSRNGDAFGYDARSQVVSATVSTNAYGYSYDSIGNSVHASRNAATNYYLSNELNQYEVVGDGADFSFLSYDADGNQSEWNGYGLQWDPENRLYCGWNNDGDFGFFRDWSGRAFCDTDNAFYTDRVFDGWNPVYERTVDGLTEGQVAEVTYVWGTDLSGSLQGAGGVGGLLAVNRDGTWYVPLYDANGNVTAYVSENGST